jgi:drug/metabolite transporter (DMT)-like permease
MSPPNPAEHRPSTPPPAWLIWAALGIVYVIWGTTYLGIRVTNETLPPLIAAGTRFVIAGAVLFAVSYRRRDADADPVGRSQWWAALLVGAGLIAGGNGTVVLAERTVPSGTVALIFALVPLWLALWDRLVGRRRLPGASPSASCSASREPLSSSTMRASPTCRSRDCCWPSPHR